MLPSTSIEGECYLKISFNYWNSWGVGCCPMEQQIKKDWPTFTGVQKNKKITRCDARNSEEHFN